MRVLILSANTGGGHNSTANALGEQLHAMKAEYKITDCLAYISEKVSDFISWGHSYVYRNLPKLFGAGYRFEENHSTAFHFAVRQSGIPEHFIASPFKIDKIVGMVDHAHAVGIRIRHTVSHFMVHVMPPY